MKNAKIACALFFLLFLAPACASVDMVRLKDAPSKDENCKLDVYANESEVKRPHETLCNIGSSTGTTLFADKSIDHAVGIAKPKACECGGEAIILNQVNTSGVSAFAWGQGSASITVIRYTAK